MTLSREELRQGWAKEKNAQRRRTLLWVLVTLAVFLLCLCVRYQAELYDEKLIPGAYYRSYLLSLRLLFTGGADAAQAMEGVGGSVLYLGALARLRITALAVVAGGALAISGAVFQTAYRNPMASPNMLGATAGVKLGNVLVVLLYSAQAVEKINLRYEFCYGFTAICVLLVFLLGKFTGSGRGHSSIMEVVMVGSILSQGLNVVNMYLMYSLDDEDLLLYQQISLGTYQQTDKVSMIIFFTVMLLSVAPVVLLRYRLNALGLEPEETTLLGIRIRPLEIIAQLCGVVMVTCAMIHCGEVGMLSMVIPYLVRQWVGADFRRVCVYSALGGGVLLMVCRTLTSFLVVDGEPIPVTFLVNLVVMPIFMVMLARQRRGNQ
jgi:iron complex transport system permease protein